MPLGDEYDLDPFDMEGDVPPPPGTPEEPPAYDGDLAEMGIGARAFYEEDLAEARDYIAFKTDGEDETFVGDEAYCMLSFGAPHDDMTPEQDRMDAFCARHGYEGERIEQRWYRLRLDPPGLRTLVEVLPDDTRVHLWNGV